MKVVAIANQKGGVGKTTTAINLSSALAMLGQRVLLIDLDPQANATSGLGLEAVPGGSLYTSLLGQSVPETKIIETGRKGLSLIPAEMDLAGVEIELARSNNHLTRLSEVLQSLRDLKKFDICLLDTPPSLGVLMTSALAGSDEVLTPLQCEWFGLEGLAKIIHVIDQIRGSGANKNLQLEGILMTMYDARTNLSRQVVEQVREHLAPHLYKTIIPRSIRLGESPSFGRTIFEHDAHNVAAIAYLSAAEEFLKRRGISYKELSPNFSQQVSPQGQPVPAAPKTSWNS